MNRRALICEPADNSGRRWRPPITAPQRKETDERIATIESAKDERTLLAAARDGDRRAFAELVTRFEPAIARTTIGMLGDKTVAEDIAQETFVRFYRALDDFREEGSLKTYLVRIAINLSLNELQKRKRRLSLFGGSVDDERDAAPAPAAAESFADADLVRWGLRRLPPERRTALTLRLIDGYSVAETAEILKIPQGTVLSRLSRAQKQLREILEPHVRGEQPSPEQ